MTNRNAYPNAMRCGTFLSPLLGVPLRPSTPRLSTLLSASQRFVCYFLSPLRSAALRPSPRLYSTQRFVYYRRSTHLCVSRRTSPQRYSTICLLQRAESIRGSPPLNSTICLLLRRSPPRCATPLDSTICFFTPLRNSALLCASHRGSTQRFVYYRRLSTHCSATPLYSTQLKPTNRRT
jgi:hypothetical protein